MNPQFVPPAALLYLGLVCLGSALAWALIAAQIARRQPLVAYERRRPVPWRAVDMAVMVLAYFFLAVAAQQVTTKLLPDELQQPTGEEANAAHMMVKMLQQRSPALVVLGLLTAVVVAPLVEEFLFRLVLQGGLEAMARRHRRRLPRPLVVALPIALPAVFFALLHFRTPEPAYRWEYYAARAAAFVAGSTATLLFSLAWLRLVRGATLRDLGFVPEKLPRDALLGFVSTLAFIVPFYAVQLTLVVALSILFGQWGATPPAPDPAAIFLFAIVWGILYHQTHRLAPSLVAHATLNATTLGLVLLSGLGR